MKSFYESYFIGSEILFTFRYRSDTLMKHVFCIGEALIDFVAENQGKDLSKATTFSKKAGGAPANVACAIARLGGHSHFLGAVGDDPFGKFLMETLRREGVDTSLVQQLDVFTTMAFVSLAPDGERDFVFSRGADRELEYDSSIKSLFRDNILHLGAATALLGGPLERSYGRYFFDALTQHAVISFDPNYRGDLWKGKESVFRKKCLPFIEKADLCKFSAEEAMLISGEEDLSASCAKLHEVGAGVICITLGSEGTYLSMGNEALTVPSSPVKAVDTTGAGDAFIGCLLEQLARESDVRGTLRDREKLAGMVTLANKAGALTTTNYGAIPSLPTQNQLHR